MSWVLSGRDSGAVNGRADLRPVPVRNCCQTAKSDARDVRPPPPSPVAAAVAAVGRPQLAERLEVGPRTVRRDVDGCAGSATRCGESAWRAGTASARAVDAAAPARRDEAVAVAVGLRGRDGRDRRRVGEAASVRWQARAGPSAEAAPAGTGAIGHRDVASPGAARPRRLRSSRPRAAPTSGCVAGATATAPRAPHARPVPPGEHRPTVVPRRLTPGATTGERSASTGSRRRRRSTASSSRASRRRRTSPRTSRAASRRRATAGRRGSSCTPRSPRSRRACRPRSARSSRSTSIRACSSPARTGSAGSPSTSPRSASTSRSSSRPSSSSGSESSQTGSAARRGDPPPAGPLARRARASARHLDRPVAPQRQHAAVREHGDLHRDVAARRAAEDEPPRRGTAGAPRPRGAGRGTTRSRGRRWSSRSPNSSASSPAIALPSSQRSSSLISCSRRAEALGADRPRVVAERDEQVPAACSTRPVGPHTNTRGRGRRRRPDRLEHLGVDAPPEALPPVGLLDVVSVIETPDVAQRGELVAVGSTLVQAPRREQEPRVDVAPARRAMAQHRHERHEAGAAGDEQERPAVLDAPREVAADRAADLELVADDEVLDEVRGDPQPSGTCSTVSSRLGETPGPRRSSTSAPPGSRPRRSGARRRPGLARSPRRPARRRPAHRRGRLPG